MKSLILFGLLFSSVVIAETQAINYQCRADAIDGSVGFSTHLSRYTAEAQALRECQMKSRRPETCRIVSCM